MLLQPTSQSPRHHHHRVSLSPPLSRSTSFPFPYGFPNSTLVKFNTCKKQYPFITCSYGTLSDENKRPMVKWNAIYKKISSTTQDPEKSSASVLNKWESQGKRLGKYELYRVVKELRKFGRHKSALEVFDWMNERGDKYRMSTSDTAIELDLIAKVRGIPSAEDYFNNLPASSKDKRAYGSLLNAYARARMREKAESLIAEMKNKGYVTHALPFNVMMTLYVKLKDYNQVELIVSEMAEQQIPFDAYTYNIWLSSRGSHGSTEKMEEVFEKMKLDRTIKPSWTTFSIMATTYTKIGQLEKAEDYLRRLESKIKGRDRAPYHCLLSLYGIAGNKFEVYRVWNTYKSIFPYIPNMGYHHVIASLVRLDDIEGAERIYEEWVSVKSAYDTRIANMLMGWYIRNGFFKKAEAFFEGIKNAGGKPDSNTWDILADGLLGERRVTETLTCYKEALLCKGAKFWKPKPEKVNLILKICEQQNDNASKEVLLGILKQAGCIEDDRYMSSISISDGNQRPIEKERASDGDGDEVVLDQFQISV